MNIIRIDTYTDAQRNPMPPKDATYRRIILYEGDSIQPIAYQNEYNEKGFDMDFEENFKIYYEGDDTPPLLKMPDEDEKPEAKEETHSHGKRDLEKGQHSQGTNDIDDKQDNIDPNTPLNKGEKKHTVQPETRQKFDSFVEQQKRDTKPKPSEIEKNKRVESSVIDGINEYVKTKPYGDKVKFVETQGSFAKGTDLAGSSDIDIFVAFDYDVDIEDIKKYSIDLAEDVLKPLSDEGSYKLMTGPDSKKYGESDVDGVEVQILGITDVSLEQVKNGFEENGMKTGNDRSPHHTEYMKKALKGKEDEVRTLKRFFKDAQVYDASQEKQGFSGFSTEVLIDKFDTFENVLEFFANFEKGSTVGDYKGKGVDTPIMIADPIDPTRNLGAAFSHPDGTETPAPNKNLGRLIKTSQHMLAKGEMPKVTTDEMPSLSVSFDIPDIKDNGDLIDKNEVHGQIQHASVQMVKHLEKEGYNIKAPSDKVTDNFTVETPRINVEYDKDNGKATIDLGMDNFEIEKTFMEKKNQLTPPSPKMKQEQWDKTLQKMKDANKGKKIEEKDGYLWVEQTRDITNAQDYLNHMLKNKIDEIGLGKMTDNIKKGFNLDKGNKKYENLTDKTKGSESYLSGWDFEDIKDGEVIDEKPRKIKKGENTHSVKSCGCNNFGDFVNIQMDCLKVKAKEGQSYGLLYDQPKVEGRKIKGTLAYAGVSLNNRLYLPEELAKGDGMTVPLLLNHASTAGAEGEMSRLPDKFAEGLQKGLEMKVGEVKLTWEPDQLTLFYEGEVTDEFFQKEIDDADMAVSLGLYYDSDSPQVCDTDCYTVLKGAEFHEVSLVYHAGFPVATIEAVESLVKNNGKKALEFSRSEDPIVEKKDLKEINWSE